MPHAMYWDLVSCFNLPSYVQIPANKMFQDILIESDVLITDFSSNSFEMAYMDKPTITYIPDM